MRFLKINYLIILIQIYLIFIREMVHIRRPKKNYKSAIITCILLLVILIQFYQYRSVINNLIFPLCPYSYTIDDKHIIFDNPSYSMADWIYGWPENVFKEDVQNSVHKISETVAYLPHGSIIYVKTDSLDEFFSNIYPHFRNQFVFITAQGDAQAPGKHLYQLEKNDSKIIHWFAQNADINESISKRFTVIPIGKNKLVI
jgi:hypothetical protein